MPSPRHENKRSEMGGRVPPGAHTFQNCCSHHATPPSPPPPMDRHAGHRTRLGTASILRRKVANTVPVPIQPAAQPPCGLALPTKRVQFVLCTGLWLWSSLCRRVSDTSAPRPNSPSGFPTPARTQARQVPSSHAEIWLIRTVLWLGRFGTM